MTILYNQTSDLLCLVIIKINNQNGAHALESLFAV